MNYAIILAGGVGTRVGANVPKQFIEVMGKPIIAYTIEKFQSNDRIDGIEIVCHQDWMDEIKKIIENFGFSKVKWLTGGGSTFQESTMKGVLNLKDKINSEDIVVISFGVSPMTSQDTINDGIDVCERHGNAISSEDMVLCTCIKDDEYSTTQNLIRETIKSFSNPWTFKYGELCKAYETAAEKGILDSIEPHTTSLYLALGKRLWFSKSNSMNIKITTQEDLDIFEGYLLLKEKRNKENANDKL